MPEIQWRSQGSGIGGGAHRQFRVEKCEMDQNKLVGEAFTHSRILLGHATYPPLPKQKRSHRFEHFPRPVPDRMGDRPPFSLSGYAIAEISESKSTFDNFDFGERNRLFCR